MRGGVALWDHGDSCVLVREGQRRWAQPWLMLNLEEQAETEAERIEKSNARGRARRLERARQAKAEQFD